MSCSVCNATAELAYSIQHRGCKHYTHSDCFPPGQKPNFILCANCDGAPPDGRSRKVAEPHTHDNIEYWRNPGKRNENGSTSFVSGVFSRVKGAVVATPTAPETPFQLLKRHVPVAQIMSQHGYGLDHILRDGLDIEDFMANGYDWDDLCAFEYVAGMGPFRCLETLHNGLGLTANHLRDNPDRLPVDAILAATKMPTSDWNKRLGLTFEENGPLHCYGDNNWNAMHCVALGLTMDDLIDFGLWRIEQYEDLLKGLTRSERAKAERDLGVTAEHIATLREAVPVAQEEVEDEEEEEEQEEQAAAVKPVRRVAKTIAYKEEEEDDDEEDEEEEEEEKPVAASRKPAARVAAPAAVQETVMEARLRERWKRDGYVGAATAARKKG